MDRFFMFSYRRYLGFFELCQLVSPWYLPSDYR